MSFSELLPCEVVPDHLIKELPGIYDGIAVLLKSFSDRIQVRTLKDNGIVDMFAGLSGSRSGVPVKQGAPAPFFAGMLPARIHADSKGARCGTCTYVTGRANSTQVLLQISNIE